jgi:hypothetical protein
VAAAGAALASYGDTASAATTTAAKAHVHATRTEGSRLGSRAGLTPKARFEQRMQVLGSSLTEFFATVGNEDRYAAPKRVVANLRRIQVRLRSTAGELVAMSTPAAAEPAQRMLVAAVREYADELDEVVAQIRSGNRQALEEIPRLKGVEDMTRATTAFRRLGYDITGNTVPSGA